MKLTEALERADRQRPNAVHVMDKIHALWELESQFAEMIGEDIPDWSALTEDNYDDSSIDLIVADPYSQVYVLSLMAYIDFAQEETDLYQLDSALANQKQAEVKALYRRHHRATMPQIKGVFVR